MPEKSCLSEGTIIEGGRVSETKLLHVVAYPKVPLGWIVIAKLKLDLCDKNNLQIN